MSAGTCVGGGATVGTAQLAATVGLSAWWFTIGSGVGLIIMGLFYAKPLRRTALETIPQFLAQNFGLTCGVFSSIISSIGILFSAVASCLPAIYIIAAIFGISFLPATILLVLAVAAYAFFGGMKSAGVGGILKMIVIWITMAIAGTMAAHSLFADPAISAVLPAGAFNLLHGDMSHILANFSSVVIGMLCTQSYIQAIFSASNPRTASVAAFTAALISLPVGLPCAMVGIYMGAAHPEVTPILSLPTYLLTEQPSLLGGIAMGGIMLSLIGSIAGLSLGIGTMLSRDIFHRARDAARSQDPQDRRGPREPGDRHHGDSDCQSSVPPLRALRHAPDCLADNRADRFYRDGQRGQPGPVLELPVHGPPERRNLPAAEFRHLCAGHHHQSERHALDGALDGCGPHCRLPRRRRQPAVLRPRHQRPLSRPVLAAPSLRCAFDTGEKFTQAFAISLFFG